MSCHPKNYSIFFYFYNLHRGTKNFEILLSSDLQHWNSVLNGTLPFTPDAKCHVPVLKYFLPGSRTEEYVSFKVHSFYGVAAGLQYIDFRYQGKKKKYC